MGHLFEYVGRVLEWRRDSGCSPSAEDLVYQNEVVGRTRSAHDGFVRLEEEIPVVHFVGDGVVNDLDC